MPYATFSLPHGEDDDDDETWIYIAHHHKISNVLNTLVLRQKECQAQADVATAVMARYMT